MSDWFDQNSPEEQQRPQSMPKPKQVDATSAPAQDWFAQNKPAEPVTLPENKGVLGNLKDTANKADEAITGALTPNGENYESAVKTNAIEVPKTLGREVYQGVKTLGGMAHDILPESLGGGGMIGHAFTDEITPEEAQLAGVTPGEEHGVLNRIGAGLGRLTGMLATGKAAKTYGNAETRPTLDQAVSVLPEALGESAGTVLGTEGAIKSVTPTVKALGKIELPDASTVKEVATAPLRAGAKVVNLAKAHPEVPGAVIGAIKGGPQGALEGGITGGFAKRILNKIPDLNENIGRAKSKDLVGNEYTPPEAAATEPLPEPKQSPLGRIEYAEPTPAPKAEGLVGNEHSEGEKGELPEPKKSPLGRVEYAEPTEGRAQDLVGNEHAEGDKEGLPERTKKHPLGRIEYAEPTEFEKPIKKEDVKSSPGTSMAKEEPKAEEPKAAEPFDAKKLVDDFNTSKSKEPVNASEAKAHERGKDIADAYDKLEHNPNDPAVKKSYDSLKKDIDEQWDHAEKAGVNLEPWDKEGQPYKNSKEMTDDVKNNKHLSFFTGGDLPKDHPLAEVDPKTGLTYNDKFRAIHDLYGHAAHGYEFGPKGEEGAYNVHAQTLSPESIPALTTETRGQNNWVNFGKHMRNAGGELLKKGDEGYLAPTDRPFAEQKAGVLPEEFHGNGTKVEEPKGEGMTSDQVIDHMKSGKDFAILQAENPQNTRISDEENAQFTKRLKDELEDKGYKPVEVGGNTKDVEGVKEHAFFVPDITPEDAAALGKKYGQQGILTSEGLHDLNKDTINPIKRDQEFLTGDKAREQQYYTTVGDKDFNVPIDFDKEVKAGEKAKSETKTMSPEEQADFDHEITSNIPMGPTPLGELRDVLSKYTDKPVKFHGAGNENTVFDLGNDKVAKISKNATKVPDLPEVLQPEGEHDIPAATGEFHVSVFPKVETEGIPQSAINEMTQKLEDKGYKWDSAEGNIGRTKDGKYVVIDSGGLEKIGEDTSEGGQGDHSELKEQVSNLGNEDLKRLGKEYGLNPDDYDFKRREPLREGGSKHPVERHQFVDDLMEAIPQDEKDNLGSVVKGMREEGTFDDAAKSSKGRADAARSVFPKLRNEVSMTAEGGGPKASTETARMTDEQLRDKGFTQEEIDKGKALPKVSGAGKKGVEGIIPEEAGQHLTPDERAGLKTDKSKQTFVDKLNKLPEVQEFVDIAQQGEGGRKWYQRGTKAFNAMAEESPEYFKEGDRDKFIDLVASTSPQQTVAMNLKEALSTWKQYVDAGRPEGKKLERLLYDNLTLPDAKVPNVMKSLAGEELWPDLSKNSNFKVPSFSKNLKGWLNHTTNDGWMALFGGMKASELQRPTGYHPLAVATRAAADALGWEPAEAQAAIWAFAKAFTEHGETEPGVIRQYSEDFADIMAHDPEVRDMLQKLGVNHDNLDAKLKAIGEKPALTGRTTPTTEDSVRKLGERVKAAGRDIPKPKDQRGLDFAQREEDEDTSFNPEEFGTKKKKSAYGSAH